MRERVAARKGHYMPASLIDSQFAALESPEGEADALTLRADADVPDNVREAINRLQSQSQT
jgi:gluconokinase